MRRLLFDRNTSWRIVKLLAEDFPGCTHVSSVGLRGASDLTIYHNAASEDYCVVAFERDFYHLALFRGEDVRVIWIRTGNLPTRQLAKLLQAQKSSIQMFFEDGSARCLQIFARDQPWAGE